MIADSRSPITPIDVNRLTDAIVLHKQWKQRLQGGIDDWAFGLYRSGGF